MTSTTAPSTGRRRQPLRRRLTLSLVALVVAVLVTAGLAMTLAVRSFLVEQLDQELVTTANNLARSTTLTPEGLRDKTIVVETDANGQLIHPPLVVQGNGDHDNDSDDPSSTNGSTNVGLSSEDIIALTDSTGSPNTIELSNLGSYRVVQMTDIAGHLVTVGLPVDQVDETFARLLVIAVVALAGAALVVAVGGGWLIRRELIPLDRVAGTARRVASLPLGSGTPQLDERVPDAAPGTEIGDVAEAMNEMLDHLGASLETRAETERQLRQFVADASHELRTPLASIRGYSELYRRPDVDDADRKTAMIRIESEADRMTTLVDDLLLLARLDQGRPLLQEPVDVSRLAAEAAADMSVAHPSHPITVKLPMEPALVLGDEDRLRQVLVNLLTNAVQHTPKATPVELSIRLTEDRLQLTVTDLGPGIDPKFQDRAFERFSRADESRARLSGGSGLGLSIVAAVVEALNGTVTLESQPGRTSFLVELPKAQPTHSDSHSS